MSFCRFSHLSGAVIDSSNAFAQNVITKCIVVRINPTNNTTLLVIGRLGEGEFGIFKIRHVFSVLDQFLSYFGMASVLFWHSFRRRHVCVCDSMSVCQYVSMSRIG